MNPPTASTASSVPPTVPNQLMQQAFTNANAQQVRLRNSGRFTINQPTPTAWQGPMLPGLGYNNGGNFWGNVGQGPLPFGLNPFQAGVPMPPAEAVNVDSALIKEFKHRRLSAMNVEAVCELLVTLTGIKSSQVTVYQEAVRKNNIGGRVLMSCDLADLKLVLQMTFGDWELFKSAVLTLREVEKGNLHLTSPTEEPVAPSNAASTGAKIPRNSSGKDLVRISVTSPSSPPERPVSKSPNVSTDQGDHNRKSQLPPMRPNVLEKQVTMEEQMICGALELLNEDAKEDALKGEESSASTLSPINSEPEIYPHHQSDHRKSLKGYLAQDETDVLYVMGTSLNVTAELPDSPSIVRKLEEAEARYSVINEARQSHQNYATVLRNVSSTSAISDPIAIPSTSTGIGVYTTTGDATHPGTMTQNFSFSGSTMVSSSYPMKSKSFGAKDFKITHVVTHQRSGKDSPRKGSKKSITHQYFQQGESSSDASSDESQKPLVMKPLGADAKQPRKGKNQRPPRPDSSQRKASKVSRDESVTSRFSKFKSSIFGPSSKDVSQQKESSSSPQTSIKKSKQPRPPVRYDLPGDDSSEPSQYFKDHGHPWKAVRAPTPLPPFGSNDYYAVIKSNNPSPTTSNESEFGSTPENISSKEEIYMSENPDLPETMHVPIAATNTAVPAKVSSVANVLTVSETNSVPTTKEGSGTTTSVVVANVIKNPLSSFVPVQPSTSAAGGVASSSKSMTKAKHSHSYLSKPKKLHERAATSSGEEAIFVPLTKFTKTSMNQSDPGLSSSSNIVESTPLVTLRPESQVGEYVSNSEVHQPQPQHSEVVGDIEQGLISHSRDIGSSLTRQAAFDPGSSRENTPQK